MVQRKVRITGLLRIGKLRLFWVGNVSGNRCESDC